MKTRFEELKSEILKRAKEARACLPGYERAYRSEAIENLCDVIKDNFDFACEMSVICPDLISSFGKEFSDNKIFCNMNRESGYLLVSDCIVDSISGNTVANIRGNATIRNVWDNATIRNAWDNATIQDVWDNATIRNVWDNATIQDVRGNATIRNVRGNATIQDVRGNATIQDVRGNATIRNVWDNATIRNVWDNATIQDVRGNAYVSALGIIACNLFDDSILRVRNTNEILHSSDNLQFTKCSPKKQ